MSSALSKRDILPLSFYRRKTVTVAQGLLGCVLVRRVRGRVLSGRIVETEAYLGKDDPACHAARGKTQRNAAMFAEGGIAYVYRIHQVFCLNAVTEKGGVGAAVLIRALEPLEGIAIMQRNRHQSSLLNLCSGPGKLCQALQIDTKLNRSPLVRSPLYVLRGRRKKSEVIVRAARIGISVGQELPLRFLLAQNRFVSVKQRKDETGKWEKSL